MPSPTSRGGGISLPSTARRAGSNGHQASIIGLMTSPAPYIDPESEWVIFDLEQRYASAADVRRVPLTCPRCSLPAQPFVIEHENLAGEPMTYSISPRWSCSRGHGNMDRL